MFKFKVVAVFVLCSVLSSLSGVTTRSQSALGFDFKSEEHLLTKFVEVIEDQEELHAASMFSTLIQLAASRGVINNVVDDEGNTLLHKAAESKLGFITGRLLRAGADQTVRNNNGKTPSDIAMEQGVAHFFNKKSGTQTCGVCLKKVNDDPVRGLFFEEGCDHYLSFHESCIGGWTRSINDSNKISCPICRRKISDLSDTLWDAVIADDIPKIKRSLFLGGSANMREDLTKRSLLIMASVNNSVQAVKLLIAAGARLGHEDFSGKTAYDHACDSNNQDVMSLLVAQ